MEYVVLEAPCVVNTFADKLAFLASGDVVFHLSFVIRTVVHYVEAGALRDAV